MKIQIALVLSVASTMALADSHTEKKGDAMMKKAPDAKKAPEPKKADPATPAAPAAPAMAQPKAPAELAAMAKGMAGNWKCTGKGVMDPANPTVMTDFKGTFKASLDSSLDKFWIKGEWNATAGKLKMKGLQYTTFDATSKKWNRLMVDNWGMSGTESSSGLAAGATSGKVVWEGESKMGGQTVKGRTTEDVDAKSVKMTVEMSPDGKKWVTGMEMTCTK